MHGRGENRFSSAQRLHHRWEFKHVRACGQKVHTRHFVIYIAPSPGGTTRLGLTVSRKVGGAVMRNRVKRLVREYFRIHRHRLPSGTDYSVIAKRGASGMDYSDVCEELNRVLVK